MKTKNNTKKKTIRRRKRRVSRSLKTITLSVDDNPIFTLCPGHVGIRAFNVALKNEGWVCDPVAKTEVAKEFWVQTRRGFYKRSEKTDKNAKPYTVMSW